MSADDPVDAVTGSISDGDRVNWELAESSAADESDKASIDALRDIERVARGYRMLHASSRVHGGSGDGADGAESRGRLTPAQWGDLTVLELARAGANGEVWRAWDRWLQREVALKFLQVKDSEPTGLHDSGLLEEARALARVRHPSVVVVYGIADHDRRVGMWMEFLEGATLAAEIERRGALPALEVVRIGLALCRALEAVESAGLVHRDIKPANVVLEATGRVVLTDFGLGQRWELLSGRWRASGTPIFMSPGVLSGEPATPRSDLYALGVTLRWALTGRSPFNASNVEELKIEAAEGPSRTLESEQPDAPQQLVQAIDRAMAPNPEERFASAAQMTVALEHAVRSMTASRWRRPLAAVAIAAGAVLVVLSTVALMRTLMPLPSPPVTRFSIDPPPNRSLSGNPANVAVSPDGRQIAFVVGDSSGTNSIWVRSLDALAARQLGGTDGSTGPFWSPDGRHIGFFAQDKLKKIAVAGGLPQILCDAPDARGGTWGKDAIVFAPVPTGPLCRVSPDGGAATVIEKPDTTREETALRWPQFLPDGKHFLFVALPSRDGGHEVFVSSTDTPKRKLLTRSDAAPTVAGKDWLILSRDGHLMAQRFDSGQLRVAGDPIAIGPSAETQQSVGQRVASASRNGVLAHLNARLPDTQLLWVDRSGRRIGAIAAPEGRYEKGTISPEGERILVVRRTSPTVVDLWTIDSETGSATRVTSRSQSRIGGLPAWSPDGAQVAFSSNRDGVTNIYVKDLGKATPEHVVFQSTAQFKEVESWSADGRFLFFQQAEPQTAWDVWYLAMLGQRRAVPYLRSRQIELSGRPSPDGRWVAFISDKTGMNQLYVQSFPSLGKQHQISASEAAGCSWSSDGRELIVFSSDGTVWSVQVDTGGGDFKAAIPRPLFKAPDGLWITPSPDHRRFLVMVPEGDAPPATITVVQNWSAEALAKR
ncbi:MAG TPA: protein kinase [Candidatus Eisenbacteria bacterium]|nr:protein kinase [Candidatus Eisenbacteria bacterium]